MPWIDRTRPLLAVILVALVAVAIRKVTRI
jgi:hypothetical protein